MGRRYFQNLKALKFADFAEHDIGCDTQQHQDELRARSCTSTGAACSEGCLHNTHKRVLPKCTRSQDRTQCPPAGHVRGLPSVTHCAIFYVRGFLCFNLHLCFFELCLENSDSATGSENDNFLLRVDWRSYLSRPIVWLGTLGNVLIINIEFQIIVQKHNRIWSLLITQDHCHARCCVSLSKTPSFLGDSMIRSAWARIATV